MQKHCLISVPSLKDKYGYWSDYISRDWYIFFQLFNIIPHIIPNVLDVESVILNQQNFDLLIFSGGKNQFEYNKSDYDTLIIRDLIEKKLYKYAFENNIPILGVCRGMQQINLFLDGNIELDKNKTHINNNHFISIINNEVVNNNNNCMVNSYHNYFIKKTSLANTLTPFALNKDDKSIEGYYYKSKKIVGIAWHPERQSENIDHEIMNYLLG